MANAECFDRVATIIAASLVTPAGADQLVAAAGDEGIVVAFDNDPAGRNATVLLTSLIGDRVSVHYLELPAGADLTDTYRSNRQWPALQPVPALRCQYYSQAVPSPSRSRPDRYPGSPRCNGAAPAARAAAQFL